MNNHLDKKAKPYLLLTLGLLVGLGIAIDWDLSVTWDFVFDGGISINYEAIEVSKKDGWDIASSVGSLLAGLGTVGLLLFGWLKADSWISNIAAERNLKLIDSISSQTMSLWHFFQLHAINFDVENDFDFIDYSKKIVNLNHSLEVYKSQFGDDQFYNNINNELKKVCKEATPYKDGNSASKRANTRDLFGNLYKVAHDECEKAYIRILKS